MQSIHDPTSNILLGVDMSTVYEPRVSNVSNSSGSNGVPSSLPIHWIDALRQCFLQRFQLNTRSLDLSNLHLDSSLLSQGLYLPLNRDVVVSALVNILRENKAQVSFS